MYPGCLACFSCFTKFHPLFNSLSFFNKNTVEVVMKQFFTYSRICNPYVFCTVGSHAAGKHGSAFNCILHKLFGIRTVICSVMKFRSVACRGGNFVSFSVRRGEIMLFAPKNQIAYCAHFDTSLNCIVIHFGVFNLENGSVVFIGIIRSKSCG